MSFLSNFSYSSINLILTDESAYRDLGLMLPWLSHLQAQHFANANTRWFFSEDRIVYAIHGGPMAGRVNFQTASYQCIRPGELWQCNWLEGSYSLQHIALHPSFPSLNPSCHLTPLISTNIHPLETGTICSLVYDIPQKRISTLLAFSQGHWEYPQEAHGDKRNPEDFARWRKLAKVGSQVDRFLLNEQANILQCFKGKGDLEPISADEETV